MNKAEFVERALAGAYLQVRQPWIGVYRMGVFNEALMRCVNADCQRLSERRRPSTVTDRDHATHWVGAVGDVRQWAILGTGETDGTSEAGEGARFIPGAREYPALYRVYEWARRSGIIPITSMRLNWLGSGSHLNPHRESVVSRTPDGLVLRVRFHLPIWAPKEATVGVNKNTWHLESGEVYYFNNGGAHWAQNRGYRPRLHLVWDAVMDGTLWEHYVKRWEDPDGVLMYKPLLMPEYEDYPRRPIPRGFPSERIVVPYSEAREMKL